MKKIFSNASFLILTFFISCTNNKKATPAQIAPEMCNCFTIVENDVVMLKEIIAALADSPDPNSSLKETIKSLTMAGPSSTLQSDLSKLSKIDDEKTAEGACFKQLHEKYKGQYDFKNEAMALQLIAELKKQNCGFAAGMLSWKWKR